MNTRTHRRSRVRIVADLDDALPRRARYTAKANLARLIVFVMWVGMTAALLSTAMRAMNVLYALRDHGRTVRVNKFTSPGTWNQPSTYCSGDTYVAGSRYLAACGPNIPQDRLPVFWYPAVITYLPSDRETFVEDAITPKRVSNALLMWVVVCSAGSTIAALLCTWCLWGYKKQWQLLANGLKTEALITAIGMDSRYGTTVYAVFYTYSLGEDQYFQAARIGRGLFGRLQQGEWISILHMPENPEVSMPYDAITAARL